MMLLENGFSSPRAADSFPAGLKVLVVDDDPTWLKILEKMLKKCSYEVTTCGLAREALRLLREKKDGFDIIISDVNMPDMDGFKLLEHVGLEMDLPVIMMSVDGETSRVMKGVQHGACDYLLKPIRMKELKNIWQHVLRKRMHDIRDIESHDNLDDDDLHLFRYAADLSDGGHFLTCADQTFLKKRKDIDSKHGDKDSTDPSAKRPRVVWSVDLHQKFVKAVNQIGFDKVGPKKILDLMNVPRLTRENVASHLQKYRLYLSRLEKENDLKSSCGGLKNSDEFPKDFGGGFGIQNTTAMQQSMAGVVSFSSPDYKPPAQSIDTKPHEIGPKGINLWPLVEPGNPFTGHISDVHKATCSPKMGLDNSIGSPKPKFGFAALDSPLDSQFTLSREVQDSPSELEYKPRQQLLEMPFVNECKALNQLHDCFYNHTTVVSQQHDLQQPDTCLSPRISVSEGDNVDSKLLSAEIRNNIIEQPLLIRQPTGSLSHSKSCAANLDIFGLITNSSIDISQNTIQNGLPGFELEPRNHISGSESAFGPSTDDLGGLYLFQGDNFATASTGFDNIEYSFPDLSNEALSFCLNGLPRFNSEYFGDSAEYAVVDQGLFIS